MTKTGEEAVKKEFRVIVENELKRCLRYQNFASLLLVNVPTGPLLADSPSNSGVPGDKLMALIQSELRETDVIDQPEKDTIAVLLLYSDKRIARMVGDRLKTCITNYVGRKENLGSPKVYLGGAVFPSHATDYGTLYERAHHIVEKARSIGQDQELIFE
jgi:hypothetical protein